MTKAIKYYRIRCCHYKKPHSSLKEGLSYLLEKRKAGIDVNSVYKCVFCGQYHIGHYPKPSARKLNRRIIRKVLKEQSTILRAL